MRLLHLVSSLHPEAGGVSQAVLTMMKGLTEEGVQNEAATIDAPNATYLQNIPFVVHSKGPGKTAWQYAPALLQWLQQHLEAYDVVIVHGLWQYHTYAARKAWYKLKGKKPKLFVMPHGMLDPYFQRAKERKLKAIRNWLFWKWTESKLINSATAMLFTCETEKLLAREPFMSYHPKAEKVVGLGVEAPPSYQEDMTIAFARKLDTPIIDYWLFISRIHKKKGVDLLIRAYLQLKKEGQQLPALVIAGPGLDTPFGQQMQQLVNGEKDIYFPGMLSGNAKWGAFYGCEVFILPSHQENFGIAVVEALACGKPVLISNQINIWREIMSNQSGIVGNDTMESVVAQLKEWLHVSPWQKKVTSTAARDNFENNFSISQATQRFLQVLNITN